GILFENSVNGSLTSDGSRVFLVDDLFLPPAPTIAPQFRFGGVRPNYGQLQAQAYSNWLKAYNLETNKLLWELGHVEVPGNKQRAGCGNRKIDELLGVMDRDGNVIQANPGGFFLAPPLPLDGKLYVLHERNKDLRLICLQPRDKADD